MSDEDEEQMMKRYDKYGVLIKRGSKGHKIVFADSVAGGKGKDLTRVFMVESS